MSRIVAVSLYTAALAAPAAADWRAVAESLFSAMPAVRAPKSDVPAWWADYTPPKAHGMESVDILFNDGQSFRLNVVTVAGKPPRIASTVRAAVSFWRHRHGWECEVPRFASIAIVNGESFDAGECSRLTAELRAAPPPAAPKPEMTAERVARMEREVERRRAGLARIQRGDGAFTSASCASWLESLYAGEEELALMRAALELQRGGVEAVQPAAAPVVEPEAVAPVLAIVLPLDAEEAQAVWCEAVAGAYAAPVAWEITGTDPEVEPAAPEVMPAAAPGLAAAVGTEQAFPSEPVPSDTWEPTAETHPIVALALSHKARETLFAMVQDGTFPSETGKATAGAWRVTLEDALALEGVGSIRLVGMPRKAYTRRAAAPVVSSPSIHVPAYGGLHISHHGAHAAVYHAPNL